MSVYYIISDNQFFSHGLAELMKNADVQILQPSDVDEHTVFDGHGVCFLNIRCRASHRQVCLVLKSSSCHIIFFIPGNACMFELKLPQNFWSSKIPLAEVLRHLSRLPKDCSHRILSRIKPSRLDSVLLAAEGLDKYMRWVNKRSVSPKTIHAHNRALIQSVGIDSMNIHNLFLSEYLSVAHVTTYRMATPKTHGCS